MKPITLIKSRMLDVICTDYTIHFSKL